MSRLPSPGCAVLSWSWSPFRVLFAMKLQAYRVACPRYDLTVSSEPARYDLTAVPRALASPGSSSHEPSPLLQSLSRSEPAAHRSARRLPWSFFPHRGINSKSPLASEPPKLTLRSVLGVSHALDGLLLSEPCGSISPHNHVRDSPLRGSIPPPSRSTSSAPRTLLSLPALACRRVAPTMPAPSAPTSGS
jgi:hypothetical protein